MKIKTSVLIGPALEWAVAKCAYNDGRQIQAFSHYVAVENYPGAGLFFRYDPSTDWAQGGPIIERECLAVFPGIYVKPMFWCAVRVPGGSQPISLRDLDGEAAWYFTEDEAMVGPTPLIAAMRCFVASKLGDEVEIPEVLIPSNSNSVPAV